MPTAMVGPSGGLVGPGGGTVGSNLDALAVSHRLFGYGGTGTVLNSRPFTVENLPVTIVNDRPFRVTVSELEVYIPPAARTTSLAATAPSGTSTITIVFVSALLGPGGGRVGPTGGVVGPGWFVPGMYLTVGGEVVQIAPSYTGGATIPLTAPLGITHAAGSAVGEATAATPSFLIFDKAGTLLGELTDAYLSAAPSHTIGGQGNVGFYAPRNAVNLGLIKSDRLVFIGDPHGQPWAGAIEAIEWGEGKEQINCPDIFSLLDGTANFDQEVGDGAAALGVYGLVLDTFNAAQRSEGEIEWGRDFTGSKVFHGDLTVEGTWLDVLLMVAERSATEFAWSVTVIGGQLVPKLVVRDVFSVPGGSPLFDGPGGNIVDQPRYTEDPVPVRNGVILTGNTTTIGDLVPEWAQWAVHEIEPKVELDGDLADPDDRRRVAEEVNVDWSLSKAEQRRLADLTMTQVKDMYATFLYAVHDQWGRPWHEGWAYIGNPDNLIPQLIRTSYWTDLHLVEVGGQPASAVLRSGPKAKKNLNKRLVVTYDRVSGVQQARILAESQLNLGLSYFATLAVKVNRTLWNLGTGKVLVADGTAIGNGVAYQVGSPVSNAIKPVVVTYRYGGTATGRGRYKATTRAAVRSSPYVKSTNILHYVATGGIMPPGWQTTKTGTLYHGSRVWHGDATGAQWWPSSVARLIGPNVPVYITVRPFLTGPWAGKWFDVARIPITPGPSSYTAWVTKQYDFEKPMIAQWDPHVDGIGVYSNKKSVVYGAVTSLARWSFASWATDAAATSLDHGISATDTTLLVASNFGFPVPPFLIQVGDTTAGEEQEDMRVTAASGPLWTVQRAQNATKAVIHEANAGVELKNAPAWDGFEYDWHWPEGDQWAQDQVIKLGRKTQLFDIEVLGTVTDIQLGSVHTITLTTEGPWGTGIVRTCRVRGFARDSLSGMNGIVLEVLP